MQTMPKMTKKGSDPSFLKYSRISQLLGQGFQNYFTSTY